MEVSLVIGDFEVRDEGVVLEGLGKLELFGSEIGEGDFVDFVEGEEEPSLNQDLQQIKKLLRVREAHDY